MEKEDQDFLIRQVKIIRELKDNFFIFQQNTRVQLLSNQLQYFQSLGSIGLAIIAILFGTKAIAFSIWWLLAGLTALVLVLYVSTNVRESNDLQSKSLADEEAALEEREEEYFNKIKEAIDADNFSIYRSFVEEKGLPQTKNSNTSYAGEIAVFLFVLMIFWSFLAFLITQIHLEGLCLLSVLVAGVFLCFALSFYDWNLKTTEFLSSSLHSFLKK